MMAELYGKADGYCKGKGGSMHIADFGSASSAPTASSAAALPIATGAGLAAQMRRQATRSRVCFFGDGASNEGTFHESLNLAAIWKLPVVFVCENNGYAANTPSRPRRRGRGYRGARGRLRHSRASSSTATTCFEVHRGGQTRVARARAGDGPTLLECKTYRCAFTPCARRRLNRVPAEVKLWQDAIRSRGFERQLKDQGDLAMTGCRPCERGRGRG